MGKTPFKMKGSPMHRNYGIGEAASPAKSILDVILAMKRGTSDEQTNVQPVADMGQNPVDVIVDELAKEKAAKEGTVLPPEEV